MKTNSSKYELIITTALGVLYIWSDKNCNEGFSELAAVTCKCHSHKTFVYILCIKIILSSLKFQAVKLLLNSITQEISSMNTCLVTHLQDISDAYNLVSSGEWQPACEVWDTSTCTQPCTVAANCLLLSTTPHAYNKVCHQCNLNALMFLPTQILVKRHME